MTLKRRNVSVLRRPLQAVAPLVCRLSSVVRRPSSLFTLLRTGIRRLSSGVCLQSAFTLIELLVVMVIAVVIMAVSLPAFLSLGRGAGMRTAVNNIRSTVALSRQWAITHREEITFVAMNNLVYPDDSGTLVTNPAYTAFNQSGERVQKGVPLPLDVTFDDPSASATNLTFKTDGGLASGATQKDIVLVDKKNNNVKTTISINGLTGGIKVE